MHKGLKILYFGFYLAIAMSLLAFSNQKAKMNELYLFAQAGDVIKKFDAGPIETVEETSVKVKTDFTYSKPGICNCNGANAPCIKTFLDPKVPQPGYTYTRAIDNYNILSQPLSYPQGATQVPYAVNTDSVNVIMVPFCKQLETPKEK